MTGDQIIIFDTTLRDGEQSPGASMTASEKLRMAHELEVLGVDVLEAGFAAASPDDLRAVKTIAEAAFFWMVFKFSALSVNLIFVSAFLAISLQDFFMINIINWLLFLNDLYRNSLFFQLFFSGFNFK